MVSSGKRSMCPVPDSPARVGRRFLLLIVTFLFAMGCLVPTACLKRGPRPAVFERPWVGPAGIELPEGQRSVPFPERTLLDGREEAPPQALARIDEIFREIRAVSYPEPIWRSVAIEGEIDSLKDAIGRLDIGARTLLHLQLGGQTPAEAANLRQAAILYMRWGLAMMRVGEVNQRVWGAEKLRQAVDLDPENPILALTLAGYLQLAGYWSNEQDLLDAFAGKNGRNDAVDLRRLRSRERSWKVFRAREDLLSALSLGRDFLREKGGEEGSPPWLDLEYARLLFLADSSAAARTWAEHALSPGAEFDSVTVAQAEMLLGVLDIRDIEYQRGWQHLERAMKLAASLRELAPLSTWMTVPWDLWTAKEQVEYLRSDERETRVRRFWSQSDPIWATPDLLEGQVEYLRRVGEAWFALSGVDLGVPGPLTDPGRVLLRYGWPLQWISTGAIQDPATGEIQLAPETAALTGASGSTAEAEPSATRAAPRIARMNRLDYGVQRVWQFHYRFPSERGDRPVTVLFGDRGSTARFTAVDSLRGPHWPPYVYPRDFGGKGYRLNTALSRFREADGKIRLVLSFDTYLPEYSVRYPAQGFRFDGNARVRSALYYARGVRWTADREVELVLDHETEISREWTFRRRAGSVTLPGLQPGMVKLAAELRLRGPDGKTMAIAVDNGQAGKLQGFSETALDGSDLLFITTLKDVPLEDVERELRPGWRAYGPDLASHAFHPRAGRVFLPGEDLAFYLEVYNLNIREDVTDAELLTSLERLTPDGKSEYTISFRGQGQTLIKYGVRQWNIIRSIGLSNLEPGSYRFRVTVYDRRSNQKIERTTEFRVVDSNELIRLYRWEELDAPIAS